MTSKPTTALKLNNRSLVRFMGDEAVDFLNDLITADVSLIATSHVQQAMLLTPQGRILYDMLISRDGHDVIIEIDADRRNDFIKKMMMYRLRRPVQITPDDRDVYVLIGIEDDNSLNDPRFDQPIKRFYGSRDDQSGDDAQYQALRYQYGVAEGASDLPPEKALPLEARLDLNQGISFEKGCYIGQEVTARTRYRGLVKRSYLPILLDRHVACPADITSQDRVVGQLLGLVEQDNGWIGLASVRLEAIQNTANKRSDQNHTLLVENEPINLIFPDRLMPLPTAKK